MSALSVNAPYSIFTDIDGNPLENGYIFIGAANLDAQSNPVNVYWDAALTIVASQPIRTLGGYPIRAGSPARMYVDATDYSVKVKNKNGSLVYAVASSAEKFSSGSIGGGFDAAKISYTPAGTGADLRTLDDKLLEEVSVLDFIPQAEHAAILSGTSTYNATDDFYAAAQRIQSLSGGKLVVPGGSYILGKQTFANGFGKGYAYQPSPMIKITGCTKPVVIEFRGVKLKIADGLKFGSFNPATGVVYNPTMPFTNQDYGADIGQMIECTNNASVSVVGACELDGNIANVTLGGTWGDTGYQRVAYGLFFYGNDNLYVENVHSHHHCTDGAIVGYGGLTETSDSKPTMFVNVKCLYNARNNFSLVGGTKFTAIDCDFNYAGKARFSSSPGAGVDFEAESSVIRNVTMINCEAIGNTGLGFGADSGDIADLTFIRCKAIGIDNYAVWLKKPRVVMHDCLIAGSSINPYSSTTAPGDATKYYNCKFTDELKYSPTGVLFNDGWLVSNDTVPNVLYDNCQIIASRSKAGLIRFGATLRNCTVTVSAGTGFIADQTSILDLNGSTIENLTILDQITTNIPANAYFVYLPAGTVWRGKNFINSSSSKIKWFSWSSGAGGASGYLGQNVPEQFPFTGLVLGKTQGNDLIGYYGTMKIVAFNSAPTTGAWGVGDRCINSTPVVGQPKSWACTSASDTTTGSITSGLTSLVVASGTGINNGDSISVVGAGAAGAALTTTVSSGGGTTTLVLAAAAGTTVVAAAVTTAGTWVSEGNL